MLTISRSLPPDSESLEIVAVKCCRPEGGGSTPAYANLTAGMAAAVYLHPYRNISWANATGLSSKCEHIHMSKRPEIINSAEAQSVKSCAPCIRHCSQLSFTVEEDIEEETEIINPAWVEISPCPCDMTFEACDVDCCCDEVTNFTLLFPCWGGYSAAC